MTPVFDFFNPMSQAAARAGDAAHMMACFVDLEGSTVALDGQV